MSEPKEFSPALESPAEAIADLPEGWLQVQSMDLDAQGIAHRADLYLVTNSVVRFHREHPEIQVRMMEDDLAALQEDFEAGRLHLVTMAFAEGGVAVVGICAGGNFCLNIILSHHWEIETVRCWPSRSS